MQRRDTVDATAIGIMVLLCALWGVQQVTIKQAMAEGLAPVAQAGLRSAGAAICVAGWIGWRERPGAFFSMVRRGGARWPGLMIGLIFAAEFLALYPGLRLTSASRGVVFLYTAPFFTAIGAHLFLPAERLRTRQMLGLGIAFGGVALAFAQGLAGGGNLLGDLLCGLSAVAWGATTVLVKANRALRLIPASHLLLYQLAGSAPFLLGVAWLHGDFAQIGVASTLGWALLFYQTVIVAFASYLTWFWLVTIYPATVIAGFTFLTPLFGILAGALLLGEPLSALLFVGLAAIVLGMRLLR